MIDIETLDVGRDGRAIARLAPARLAPGSAWRLPGPSGSGKTTALFTLAGLLPPVAGSVTWADTGAPLRRGEAAVVFQDLLLVDGLSVLENVLLAPFALARPQDAAAARALLDRLGVGHLAGRRADRLSRGEAQRVAVARALVGAPRLLLADEPTASLDDAHAAATADLLLEAAAASGAALVIATHDSRLAARIPQALALAPLQTSAEAA
jgi:putative ABC transport system ATP-binding protein